MKISNAPAHQMRPRCIASTHDLFKDPVISSGSRSYEKNVFRHSALSADGTTIITHNADQHLRTFILPSDLLTNDLEKPLQLTPYTTSDPCKSHAFTLYPGFTLSDPSTTLVLQSRADLPLKLLNALDLSYTHASYPWIDANTEAYLAPYSLTFSPNGRSFVAGGREAIAVFDVTRYGSGPVAEFKTRASRKVRRSFGEVGTGLSGLVTALSVCPATGVLAAGSTEGQVALYSEGGMGEKIMAWSLRDGEEGGRRGSGVMQVVWAGTGRYLLVGERQSDEIGVFDIRAGKRLATLVGRGADSTLGLEFEVLEGTGEDGVDVWAGGVDGSVRIWEDITAREGDLLPSSTLKLHGDAVSNVMVHSSRSICATTSGIWPDPQHLVKDDGIGTARFEFPNRHGDLRKDVTLRVWATVAVDQHSGRDASEPSR